jgi:hypothetical protein
MNTTTVVLAAVVFALVGTLVFAAVAPYLSGEADARCGQRGDLNDKEPGCGFQAPMKPRPH